jgi:hypothetical protein
MIKYYYLGVAKEEPEITTYSPPIDFKLGTTASQGIHGLGLFFNIYSILVFDFFWSL